MPEQYYGTKLVEAWPEGRENEEEGEMEAGYAVKYEDGYISWSPTEVFEKAYQPLTAMSFGHAIEALKAGKRVCRAGWNGRGIFIELQVPDENSKMTSPYIFINTTGLQTDNQNAPKSLVPWLASQTDMLSIDWMVVTD